MMDTLFLLIVTCATIAAVQSAEHLTRQENITENRKQLKLYEGEDRTTASFSWQEAQDLCVQKGGNLLKVPSDYLNSYLQDLTSSISILDGSIHAWIGAKKSEDTSWYRVDGQRVGQDVLSESPIDQCAYIDKRNDVYELSTIECSARIIHTLCQSPTPCTGNDVEHNGFCYHLHEDTQKKDWNRARQYCREVSGRDLAYTHVKDSDLLSQIIFDSLWVGLTSRNWKWRDNSAFTYSKFRGGVTVGDCVYIDPRDEGKWDAKNCTEKNTHFICEVISEAPHVTPAPTPAPTPVSGENITPQPTSLPTTPATQEPNAKPSDKEPSSTDEPILQQMYIIIIGVVGGVLLLLIIIIVAVIVSRGRRRKTPDDDNITYNNHITAGSTISLNTPALQPSTLDGNVYSESPLHSTTGPYSQLDDTIGTGSGYKTGPDGAVYSVPDKKNHLDTTGPIYANS